jgi:hypothetical protein
MDKIICVESRVVNCLNVVCNISFKEHLPEDGHNRWPKHVAGYVDYSVINLHISM